MVCRAGIALLCCHLTRRRALAAATPKEYQLHGQVLAVRAERQEMVIRHGDIENFMPGMTMPFRVKDQRLLDAAAPGDLVTATLVVQESDAWLSRVTRTGRREPLPPDAPAPHRMEPPLGPGAAVPDASFIDQDGRTLQTASLRGKPWALTFVYTRCPLPDVLSRTGTTVPDRAARHRARRAAPGRSARVDLHRSRIRPAASAQGARRRCAARTRASGASSRATPKRWTGSASGSA